MKRGKIFGVIVGERHYQDAQQKNGRFEEKVHTVGEELLLMKVYLDKAIAKYANNFGDAPALHGIRKVAALAVRCMENHGALPREELEISNDAPDVSEEPGKEKKEDTESGKDPEEKASVEILAAPQKEKEEEEDEVPL